MFTTTLSIVTFLRAAAAAAKTIDGTDYTLGQLLRIMAAGGGAAGAAGAEVVLTEVLAISGSFYIGALTGSFIICTAERLLKGADQYSPRLSVYDMKVQYRQKVEMDMPDDIEEMVADNPEMRGAATSDGWGDTFKDQFSGGQFSGSAYA